MKHLLNILQPKVVQFPAGDCANGKALGRSNRAKAGRQIGARGGENRQPLSLKWVTLQVYAVSSGYSEGALRQKMRRGQFIEGKHFRKAPDGRVLVNVDECQNWGINK